MRRRERDARLATRIVFLVSGFGLACWAPLVPLAKARLELDDGALGLLLLCLGLGSVAAMQGAGPLVGRIGARPIILIGGLGQAVLLPLLALAPTIPMLAAALLLFGAALGLIDVGMNVHAVQVETCAGRPMMSGFHALFSIGGFAGALLLTVILSVGIGPLWGTLAAVPPMIASLLYASPRLVETPRTTETTLLVVPRGAVVLLAVLAAVAFLSEGAMLDWGALLLESRHLLPTARAGIGYSVFAVAMTLGRLAGDSATKRFGDRRILFWGGLLAVAGVVVLLAAPIAAVALLGFALVGLGAANTVPVLFRIAGTQRRMPPGAAIAAVTSVGYAGVLAGPAGIGIVAGAIGLPGAFTLLAALLCLVPLSARIATKPYA